jgi:hypothetical protein
MSMKDEDGPVAAGPVYREFDSQNAFDSYRSMVTSLVRSPASFFREMPMEGGFLNPTLFLLINLVICGFLSTILNASMWPLFRVPVLGTIGVYLTSAILYLLTYRLFGGKGSFEATFRISAYSSVVFLVMWISVLNIFAFGYGCYLLVLGTERVHQVDRSISVASVLLSVAASLVLLMLFGFWRWYIRTGLPF